MSKVKTRISAVSTAVMMLAASGLCCIPESGYTAGSMFSATVVSAAEYKTQIVQGKSLYAGDSIISSSGTYKATLQADGHIIIRNTKDSSLVWASDTSFKSQYSGYRLSLQPDGNLTLNSNEKSALWCIWTNANGPLTNDKYILELTDQGLLQIVTEKNKSRVLWNSGSELSTHMTLKDSGSIKMYSPDKSYFAHLQLSDGNFVVYKSSGTIPVWSTNTKGKNFSARITNEGEFKIYNTSVAWTTGKLGQVGGNYVYKMHLTNDGELKMMAIPKNAQRQDCGNTVLWSSKQTKGLSWPVPGFSNIISEYGYREFDNAFHNGIDITGGGIMGADIVAADNGVVTSVTNSCPHNYAKYSSCGCAGGYGRYLTIQHNDGTYSTLYAHCSNILVTQGQAVTKGQKIATVGTTGFSTGAHLHFEVRKNGIRINPKSMY